MRPRQLLLVFIVAVLLSLASLPTSIFAQTPGLHVQGVTVVNETGQRFVFAGINMEMYRDYDHGCGWVTDGTYAIRDVMADKVKALGVNAARLNYSYRFLDTANLVKFLDMAQELTKRGMYVMPSDHTFTGGSVPSDTTNPSYAMMKQIVEGMRARGVEDYLIMNPWNEVGPDMSTSAWIAAQKAVIGFLRDKAGFKGIIVLDGTGWSTLLDVNVFKEVLKVDSNVIFSNHLYPNIPSLPSQIWTAAKQVPLVVGELGQENPGASALDPNYVKSVISGALNTGIPAGHNGLFAWIYAWCDSNKMLEDWEDPSKSYTASSSLTSHGVLWRDDYYNKVIAPPVITPLPPNPTATVRPPTATSRPPSATPRPSAATPTRTTAPPIAPTLDCSVLTTVGGKKIYVCV